MSEVAARGEVEAKEGVARLQLQFSDGAVFARPEDAPAAPLADAPPSPPRPKRAPRRAASEAAPKPKETTPEKKTAPEPAARQGSLF
uniref:hypothetical protein n=1 Tax=Methylobacterium radiotolerans TaxID=31998 RepID=UPI002F351AC9